MLIVRFVRNDDKPNEEYYYQHHKDALYHIRLFKEDNSGLYKRIELIVRNNEKGFEDIIYTLIEGSFKPPPVISKKTFYRLNLPRCWILDFFSISSSGIVEEISNNTCLSLGLIVSFRSSVLRNMP